MLILQNICFFVSDTNGKKKEILKNINLSFEKGKTYVITGPNGSGKSTLAKIIMGIINQASGNIFFENEIIDSKTITERANLGISYAFQKPATFKGVKVRKLLDVASGKKNNVGDVCEYLSMVGLCAKDYIDRSLDDKLSGGEQKRIELALTLARKAKINIFDEPEAGIDIWSFDNLTHIFKHLKNSVNIIVSHQRKILEIADEVILLEKGEIRQIGPYKKLAKYLEGAKCRKLGGQNE